MRTTTQTNKSKYKVVLGFFMNGWTFSYFEDKEHISRWVEAMEETHGRNSWKGYI